MANEKDFQEITLIQGTTALSMVGGPGIITLSGVTGTATGVEIVLTNDNAVPANNLIRLNIPEVVPIAFVNPILSAVINASIGYAFYLDAARLTFKLVGAADGTTAVIIRWFPVRAPY